VDHVVLNTPRGPMRLKNDFVLALIGYHPDYDFLRSMGIELSADLCRPVCDQFRSKATFPAFTLPASSLPDPAPTKSSSKTAASMADRSRKT